jgi:S-adenosylmethionine:tRNA ribosyltransferase-isomerase
MKLADFDFDLPEDLIATRPARPRTAARLLLAEGGGLAPNDLAPNDLAPNDLAPDDLVLSDLGVADLPDLLGPGDRLVLNDTRVIPARLSGTRTRQTGQGPAVARVEVTLMEPVPGGGWSALVKPLRKLALGEEIVFSERLSASVTAIADGRALLRFSVEGADFDAALAEAGEMPLPPYIAAQRPPDAADRTDYQTVFARHPGAVAAPTASLHFDAELLARLAESGVAFSHVTLHVGAGTFLPVKVEDVTTHRMHAEWGEVGERAAAEINATRAAGGRIIAVGTTALRLIETAADDAGRVHHWQGPTDIFIYPGYRFLVTDGLMTNFHLPKSTLLMLVSALMGQAAIRRIYAHAVAARYRFFSYGDASLLLPHGRNRPPSGRGRT